jgi:membrane-bound lytic murein transglycosylase D
MSSMLAKLSFITSFALAIGLLGGCNSNVARNSSDPSETLYYAEHHHFGPNADVWARIRDGLRLDIPKNDRVAKYEEWYSSRPKLMEAMQNNAQNYLFHIVDKIAERGLPPELALLPAVESNYQPHVTSHAGAAGLWQFIPSTGKHYGLEQSTWYDERRDLLASTDVALNYLTYLHQYFDGDWEKALAAYNAGEGTVGRAVKKRGNASTDYWSLDLPRESEEYVPRLMALANIVRSPRKFNVSLARIPNRAPLATIEVDRAVDLKLLAKQSDLDVKEFKTLNSAHVKAATKPGDKRHLLVPVAQAESLRKAISSMPTKPWGNLRLLAGEVHVVKRGDTLSSISRAYGVSVNKLRRLNNINGNLVRIGDRLALAEEPSAAQAKRVATVVGAGQTYRVKSGDTLWSIAQRHKVTVDALRQHNGLSGSTVLKPGQTLQIPSLVSAKAELSISHHTTG